MVEKLPLSKKIIFAIGQFGWSLVSYAPGMLLIYYYMPPEEGTPIFTAKVFQGSVLGILTVVGLAYAIGRLFDAVTDPLIASLSDRSHSKMGRRRKFLSLSVVPFALLSVLVFTPPFVGTSFFNSLYLIAMLLVFYWFMTMYVTPYFAWMSELGHTPDERLFLSTLISFTWAIGTAVAAQTYLFQDILQGMGFASETAFLMVIGVFALIGFLAMLLPIVFIDENKYCKKTTSTENAFESLKNALKEKNFRIFAISDLCYWVALTIISSALVYFVVVLLRIEKGYASTLQLILFGCSFLFYAPVHFIAKKTGKKPLLKFAFLTLGAVYALAFFLNDLWIPELQGAGLMILMSFPIAIFGILPNAIVADLAESVGRTTGEYKAGIFFGARTFMQKMGQMLGGLILPSLLLLGKTTEQPLGVKLIPIPAILFAAAGYVLFTMYNEKKVLDVLKEPAE
jgi:GPH family glycoside/pentoside/hexuronide:cation symporter